MRAPVLAVLALLLAGCASPSALLTDDALAGADLRLAPDAPVLVAASDLREREGNAAIDPRDPLRIAVAYNELTREPLTTGGSATEPILPGLLRNAVSLSRDGGATWTRVPIPTAADVPLASAWAIACWTFDPTVAIDGDGVVHVTSMFIGCGGPLYGSTSGLLHATVTEEGVSEPHVMAIGAGGLAGVFHDRQWTAVDVATGRLGAAWTAYTAAGARIQLLAAFSDDGGATWSPPEEVHAAGPVPAGANHLVHALFDAEGTFRVTTYACDATREGGDPFESGQCLRQWARGADGAWTSADMPIEACAGAPAGAGFGYASGAAATSTLYAAAPVFVADEPAGVCVFASDDAGATWPRGVYVAGADHPTLAVTPEGDAAVFLLSKEGALVRPTLVVLDPTLAERARAPLGAPFDPDPDANGFREYGDYDGAAASGARYFWMLTQPQPEGPAWRRADIHGYGGAFLAAPS